MRAMRGDRLRVAAVAAAVASLTGVLVVGALIGQSPSRGPDGTGPGGSGQAVQPTDAPIVYYELLDAAGSSLMERRLDGRSLARVVATRPEIEDGRAWIVDPAGTLAVSVVPGADDQRLEAISIASGTTLWEARTPLAPMDLAAWSADGRRFAIATIGTENRGREAVVVDASNGETIRVAIPEDVLIQGFDPDGALILRQRRPAPEGVQAGWQFLRVEPGTTQIERLTTLPEVGPTPNAGEDVDPAIGLGVDIAFREDGQGTEVQLWDLSSGARRVLATLPSVDRVAIDPSGLGVAMSVAQTIRFMGFGGGTADLFLGDDPISDFWWSAGGGYLAISSDRDGPALTIVERSTGRSVVIPIPGPVAGLFFVRLVREVPLPASPLPAVEPTPTPTPGPSGADVAGFPGLLTWWVDRSGPRQIAHVARLVPTTEGGMRVATEMPPIELGPVAVPDDGGPQLRLLPRPGTRDVLVWVHEPEATSGWLWDGASSVMALDLPPDWPDVADDIAWRPDGQAIAGGSFRATTDGDFEGTFVIAAIGGSKTTIVPIVGEYDRLEGWWSTTELRVGHGICTEGCEGRYSWSARLRIGDRRLTELRAADRAKGQIDQIYVAESDIVLSPRNEDPSDNILIRWPTELGSVESLDIIGLSADRRSLVVARRDGSSTTIYRIDDPIGRAVSGRVEDPRPTIIGKLPARGLTIDISPDQAWALAFDRVRNASLVRLSDGRVWPLDRDRELQWAETP